jgi:hypothetical protein
VGENKIEEDVPVAEEHALDRYAETSSAEN